MCKYILNFLCKIGLHLFEQEALYIGLLHYGMKCNRCGKQITFIDRKWSDKIYTEKEIREYVKKEMQVMK